MNTSLLVHYNSTAGLSSRLVDMLYVYVIPSLSVAIICLKLISITVLTKLIKTERSHGNIFNYMLTFEVADFSLAIVMSFVAIFKCGNLCSLGYDFVTMIFGLALYSYVANVIYIFETFNEIAFAVSRIVCFSVGKKEMRFRTQLIIMLIAAAISTVPTTLITRTIAPIGILGDGRILYQIVTSDFALDKYWTISLLIFTLMRTLFLYIAILVLNILVIHKFRAHVLRKTKLLKCNIKKAPENPTQKVNQPSANRTEATTSAAQHSETHHRETVTKVKENLKTDRRIVKLLLSQSLNYLIGNLPNSLSPILFLTIGTSRPQIYNFYASATLLLAYVTHGTYTIIYFFHEPKYKKTCLKLFGFGEES